MKHIHSFERECGGSVFVSTCTRGTSYLLPLTRFLAQEIMTCCLVRRLLQTSHFRALHRSQYMKSRIDYFVWVACAERYLWISLYFVSPSFISHYKSISNKYQFNRKQSLISINFYSTSLHPRCDRAPQLCPCSNDISFLT